MHRRTLLTASTVFVGAAAAGFYRSSGAGAATVSLPDVHYPVTHSAAEWRRLLSPAAYEVLRKAGTEAPFSSPLLNEHRAGTFNCAGCAQPLFASATKFDSGTGWPSFWNHLPGAVLTAEDRSFGMRRTEVHCSQCGGHLGHLFHDGPQPTGLRYCMDGVALSFTPTRA